METKTSPNRDSQLEAPPITPARAGYTLITGGSHGIGRALAEECARRGQSLVLIALPNELLDNTAIELRKRYSVDVRTLGLDLSREDSIEHILDWLQRSQLIISRLINNVGFGRSGLLETHPLSEYRTMMRLNNETTVSLTYALLPQLRANRGSMLNVSSMEATLPLPYKAVYTGTKSFIYAFSLAMREELRPDGVDVSVLCPGPVLTNEDGLKRIEAQGSRSKLLVKLPEDIAPVAIDQWMKGRGVIIPGRLPKVIIYVMHFIPVPLKMRILERIFSKYK
jgi:hypothetical protein